MADLPTWDEMSDLDKGAALMHLHKREWEGTSYAVENYPVRYFDDPHLTNLERRAACRHAAQFRTQGEALSLEEYQRLYELALNEPDRRCLWAASHPSGKLVPLPSREEAVELLTVSWPKYNPDDDRSLYRLLSRNVPGGEWHEVPFEVNA
jgi:hypothetical protein